MGKTKYIQLLLDFENLFLIGRKDLAAKLAEDNIGYLTWPQITKMSKIDMKYNRSDYYGCED